MARTVNCDRINASYRGDFAVFEPSHDAECFTQNVGNGRQVIANFWFNEHGDWRYSALRNTLKDEEKDEITGSMVITRRD